MSWELLFIVGQGLPIVVAPFIAEHQLWGVGPSVVVAHGLTFPMACGIFPDQGPIPCPLHQQADSPPLDHQRRPQLWILPPVCYSRDRAATTLKGSHTALYAVILAVGFSLTLSQQPRLPAFS